MGNALGLLHPKDPRSAESAAQLMKQAFGRDGENGTNESQGVGPGLVPSNHRPFALSSCHLPAALPNLSPGTPHRAHCANFDQF